jgi:hypothetical protein
MREGERSEPLPQEGGRGHDVAAVGDSDRETSAVLGACYSRCVAPLPVIDEVFRVALRWSSTELATNAVNVIHIRSSTLAPAAIYAVLDAHVTANMWGHTKNTSQIASVDITPLDGVSVTSSFVTGAPAKWCGAETAGDINPAGCTLIKLKTSERGRSHRGRIYLPWNDENVFGLGKLGSTERGIMQAAWNTFVSAIEGADVVLQVASYKLATSLPVESTLVELYEASQRRRLHRNSS